MQRKKYARPRSYASWQMILMTSLKHSFATQKIHFLQFQTEQNDLLRVKFYIF